MYVLVTSPCASACSGIPTSAAFRSRDSNRVNVSASRTPTKEDAGLAEGDNYSGHILGKAGRNAQPSSLLTRQPSAFQTGGQG